MNVDRIREIINRQPNLSTALGMEFISTPDEDMCMATMRVDERNRQPFGFLSGGASLALAEAQPPALRFLEWRCVAGIGRKPCRCRLVSTL